MALVLNLEKGECVSFGNGILIRFEEISFHGNSLRLTIEAPKEVKIERLGKKLDIKRRKE